MVVVDMVMAQIDWVAAEAVNYSIVEADNSVEEVEVDYCAAEAGLIVAEHCCFGRDGLCQGLLPCGGGYGPVFMTRLTSHQSNDLSKYAWGYIQGDEFKQLW